MDVESLLRIVAGIVLLGYAAVLLASRAKVAKAADPLADMRIVLDLAAKLRAAGKAKAATLCQQLLDELLNPSEPTP